MSQRPSLSTTDQCRLMLFDGLPSKKIVTELSEFSRQVLSPTWALAGASGRTRPSKNISNTTRTAHDFLPTGMAFPEVAALC